VNETQTPKGKEYLSGWTPWRIKRYWFYGIVTLFALGAPWITIEGNHLFLLSFDKLKLHLMFIQFDMQELYLMPFLLMIILLLGYLVLPYLVDVFSADGCVLRRFSASFIVI
jgi:polyferredoxin